MKKVFTYSAIVLLLATAVACNKTDSVFSGKNSIRLAIASPATRALVENDADLQQMQSLQVYDLLDGVNYFAEGESVTYVNNLWTYDSGNGYTWKKGTHTFFAFTKGAGAVTLADTTLAVSKTLTTADENQVDIVYSNVVAKTDEEAADDNYKAVPLTMDHLFAAITINVVNCTSDTVIVNSVSKPAIKNNGSATVHFGLDTTTVSYGAVTPSGAYVASDALSDMELPSQGLIDVMSQDSTKTPYYWVVWPQTVAEDEIQITVNYTVKNSPKSATISIPASVWEARNKYRYNLNIYPTQIQLKFEVMPWDAVEVGKIDTSTGSINMSNVTWMNSKVYVNNELVNTLVNNRYKVVMYKNAHIAVAQKYAENVYEKYAEDVYDTYAEDVTDPETGEVIHHAGDIKTYAEDVTDPETGEIIHHAGDQIILHHAGDNVLDENDNPIIIHKKGDYVLDEEGHQVYQDGGASPYTYYPAQGFFTVNYPKSGLFKITFLQAAYWDDPVPENVYEVWIYDDSTNAFRKMNAAGETITNNTVYFQVRATSNVPATHDEYRAQIDILFKPADSNGSTANSEWISAYSEVRANYACVIEEE